MTEDDYIDYTPERVVHPPERAGMIELHESWEVTFRPYESCLERVGDLGRMMEEIAGALYYPEAPTWRDEVGLTSQVGGEIRFTLGNPNQLPLAPNTPEHLQERIMQMMADMGYEGWSLVHRVVTARANNG